MFDHTDTRTLRATLDCIPVAMFAAERPSPADAFRMLCINRAFEDESGLANPDVTGLRPMDILPPNEAEAVESRYAFCARQQKVIQYQATLHLKGEPARWYTVLHPVPMSGRVQRIIGTVFTLSLDDKFPAGLSEIENGMADLPLGPRHAEVARPPLLAPAAKVARRASLIVSLARPASGVMGRPATAANGQLAQRREG